jgi:hypothetical protein
VALLPELKKGISHEIEVATRGLEHDEKGNLLMVKEMSVSSWTYIFNFTFT